MCFNGYIQHNTHATGVRAHPCVLSVSTPKITLSQLGEVLHQLACSDIGESIVPRLIATNFINNYMKCLNTGHTVLTSNMTWTL